MARAHGGDRLRRGATYELDDGTAGEMRVHATGSHLRITWEPSDWPRASTVQVRVIASGERTVVAFHQEHLPGATGREARRTHFRLALDGLERMVTDGVVRAQGGADGA